MDILQKIVEMFEGQEPENFFWYTVWRAVVVSKRVNYDRAMELIHKASEPLEFLVLHST